MMMNALQLLALGITQAAAHSARAAFTHSSSPSIDRLSFRSTFCRGPNAACGVLRRPTPATAVRAQAPVADADAGFAEFRDPKTGEEMTLAQKEELYLDSIAGFYDSSDANPMLSDEQYEELKLDLAFSDSKVARLSKDEIKYLIAQRKYAAGTPMMTDKEFDELRLQLRARNSILAYHASPSCKVETGTCKMDLRPDSGKQLLLYTPAAAASILVFTELTYYLKNWDPLITFVLGSPFLFLATKLVTEQVIFQNPLITSTVCPSCNAFQTVYFGDILFAFTEKGSVPSTLEFKCSNCKIDLVADREKMLIETPAKV